MDTKPPLPPFTVETAVQKVRAAEDGWNSRNPEKIALAYSQDSKWRNRSQFIQGRDEIIAFLTEKWADEGEYRLIKELFAHHENRIAVRFAYEYQDAHGNWFRAYGNTGHKDAVPTIIRASQIWAFNSRQKLPS